MFTYYLQTSHFENCSIGHEEGVPREPYFYTFVVSPNGLSVGKGSEGDSRGFGSLLVHIVRLLPNVKRNFKHSQTVIVLRKNGGFRT